MYTDIKTFEDACMSLNMSNAIPDFAEAPENFRKHYQAAYQLPIIIAALNESWTPDWKNDDEEKHYPFFWMNNPNAEDGFSFGSVRYHCSYTDVGSRLCFQNEEVATYAAKQFLALYKDYFIIPQ